MIADALERSAQDMYCMRIATDMLRNGGLI